MRTVKIATRRSELAVAQATYVGSLLNSDFELVYVTTQGDRDQASALSVIGGQGIFTKEVQRAVLDGMADIAVHSAKDLPSATHIDLAIRGVPKREDVRDVLIGSRLSDLAEGSIVYTSSNRRKAQLLSLRPDIEVRGARGSIATRMKLAGHRSAVFVAKAALDRLGISKFDGEILPLESFTPQVGQGALAVEALRSDDEIGDLLQGITDLETFDALMCERAFLSRLGAGCTMPVGAYAVSAEGLTTVNGFIGVEDGSRLWRASASSTDPQRAGRELAEKLLQMSGVRFGEATVERATG
ncbi:hydroxymethylbilane synthase [Ferrithrix thermotolerans DSM 19514]|uniref:Hydroxymethylbilane synthase n=1 Tax=Ferrithrix thermotolerans DSM 19514 TaxID=1121881 RepID=A0A1M4SP47_9ACTN|nr:hydroxymethylbilane synthase [Ferrithrix thermotolerans]SHE33958.1 hydroxymethylbilane synthase [Ferrithrix thermotolerans DSM 19514]